MTAQIGSAGPATTSPSTRHVWLSVGRSAGARVLVLPVSAILGIINTRLIIGHFGEGAFAQYGLLVGLAALVPFADLGITASVINSIGQSDDPSEDPAVVSILTTGLRVLACSCVALLATAWIITASGVWPALLGRGLLPGSGSRAAGLCVVAFAFTLLVGFGQQILRGLGMNHVAVLLLGLQTPVVLVSVLVIIAVGAPLGGYVAVFAYLATFAVSAVAAVLASRRVHPVVGLAIHNAFRVRTVRGAKVFGTAWPVVVQMVALPIAMQTDRLVLSHVSDLPNLARYNLASQIFTPVWAVVSSAGVALWPIFARARARKDSSVPSPQRMALFFGAAAAVVCLGLALASPWLTRTASGGAVHLGLGLVVTFSVLMVLQALKYPLGVYLTDPRGLRFQALMVVLLLPLNLGLSWVLAERWGAVGPVIGSAVGVFFCQVVANWWYVRWDLRRTGA